MKLKKNQIVRIKSSPKISIRMWGRLAKVKKYTPSRNANGTFNGSKIIVQPRNRKNPLITSKTNVLER